MNEKTKKIIILIGDIGILYASLYLTLLARYQALPDKNTWQTHLGPFSIAFIAWILIFYISNLYSLHSAVNNARILKLTMRAIGIAGLVSAVFFYANPAINIAPKTNLLIFLIISFILVVLWRRIFNFVLYSYSPKSNIAVIGFTEQVRELINTFEEKPHLGYSVALIISGHQENINGIPVTSDIKNLKKIIKEKNITTIVLAVDPQQSNEMRSILFSCLPLKINFISLPKFYETITGKVPIEAINKMWFLENLNESNKSLFDFTKRIYDLIISVSLFILTFVFWPLISLILKIEHKESAFFTQTRLGKNGQPFKIIKFRTQRTVANNPDPAQLNDTRTTRFGNFLRKTRIDEIPQIINIIKGEMSFVGPRPERPELAETLEKQIPFFRERTLVKPGITGWDQISGEYHSPTREDTLKKLQYDLFYIKNRSIYLDLSIILKTIATVISSSGR